MTRRIALVLALLLLPLPAAQASARPRMRYVPFLGRRVPVRQLNRVARATDASFRDYGASGKSGARATFGLSGAGVKLAILDTGVDPGHEQLDGSKVAGWVDLVNGRPTPYDDNGHGTHVASIAAGGGSPTPNGRYYRGVAPGASLYIAKVLDALGRGSFETIIDGISWAVAQGADIISMSLGAVDTPGVDPLEEAVDVAVQQGVTVVISAGNKGPDYGTIGTPGVAEAAITVGASSEWTGGRRPERSYGPYLASFSSRGGNVPDKPDVIAPGVTVAAAKVGTRDGYTIMSGTSMSAPYVAGTVALMLQADPSLAPARVKDILRSTALDCGLPGYDKDWGYGLVNTYSAVATVEGQPTRDIFPPHYFFWRHHDSTDHVGVFYSDVVTIGTGSAVLGPPEPPRDMHQPIAVTINALTEDMELDAVLADMTDPGESSELSRRAVYTSWLKGRSESFGILPTTPPHVEWPRLYSGYVLFVGPSLIFGERNYAFSYGVDLFYA